MAGDWIKMRTNLRTNPKVARIASALKADRLRVIGGLHAVWCLFDEHSIDGKLDGYSIETLDDELRWPGFSAAMVAVQWLEEGHDSLSTPRFDEHNGQSAKRRATESERKRNERKVSAVDADKKRSREEKRREEKIEEKKEKKEESAPPCADAPQVVLDLDHQLDASEPTPNEPTVEPAYMLPLNTGDKFPIMPQRVAEFSMLYPAVDVMAELKKMDGWLISNPTRRKTKSGVMKFVNAWLVKQQNEAPQARQPAQRPNGRPSINSIGVAPGTDDNIFDQMRKEF